VILARMLDRMRTLRFKLALLYITIFGTIQSALCVSIILVRDSELHQEVVMRLVSRGQLIADALNTDPMGTIPASLLLSPSFENYAVQVSSGGSILKISEGAPRALPPAGDHPDQDKRLRFVDLAGEGDQTISMLVYSFPHSMPDGRLLEVQIGRQLSDIDARMGSLRRIVYFSLGTALIMSLLGSWYAAARSLAPIAGIARNAREIAATDLHRRLPVPRGQDEVAQMVRVLNQMLERLEHAFIAHEKFTADISHELKTPLTELVTEASLMIQRPRLPVEHEDFEFRIKERLKRLSEMVDSMLTLAQIESGLLPPIMAPVAINDIVAECAQGYKTMADERGVALVTHLAMPGPDSDELKVAGNPHLLEIAIANLIRNAIRFSAKGKHVEVFVEEADEQIRIIVGDLGPGIPPAHIDRIFDRYFTVRDGRPTGGGAGLGLAIARGIAVLYGGTLSAANRPPVSGPGCLFTLSLPRYRGNQDADS
jgi:signal transduction histidine kinase